MPAAFGAIEAFRRTMNLRLQHFRHAYAAAYSLKAPIYPIKKDLRGLRILHFQPVEFLRHSSYPFRNLHEPYAVMALPFQGVPMKDVNEVLQHKETDIANVRNEIQSLKLVSSLLADELAQKDTRELLQQKEADIDRVRREIENLKIVAPLLSEEETFDEPPKMGVGSAAEEERDIDDRSEATGTGGVFSSGIANPRPTFWQILKRKA